MTSDNLFQQFSLFNPPTPESSQEKRFHSQRKFSDYIVYVDESGDHGIRNLDPKYPVFVLVFCVFHKRHYAEHVVPVVQKFKFKHFGHDLIVLHEHEIIKEKGLFRFPNKAHKNDFMGELTSIIEGSNFILISCVIQKERLRATSSDIDNPYHLALGFCLETLYEFLGEKSQDDLLTHVLVEQRGEKENKELELEFRRICDGQNRYSKSLPFNIHFADKRVNSAGLQLADLIARPVGVGVLRPEQENRAFNVLREKFYCEGGREKVGVDFEGWGLKIFPKP